MTFAGKSALVTGSGSGIGKALALALASRGCSLTLADIQGPAIERLSEEILEKYGIKTLNIVCDITTDEEQQEMFEKHTEEYNSLNYVLLNAGVPEKGDILSSGEAGPWELTFNTNLRAQLVGARLSILAMSNTKSEGAIVFTSSAGGLIPVPFYPVYASCKAALNHFVASSAPRLLPRGIRICALCPSATDTSLVSAGRDFSNQMAVEGRLPSELVDEAFNNLGPLIPCDKVAKAAMYLLADNTKTGVSLILPPIGGVFLYAPKQEQLQELLEPVYLDDPVERAEVEVSPFETDMPDSSDHSQSTESPLKALGSIGSRHSTPLKTLGSSGSRQSTPPLLSLESRQSARILRLASRHSPPSPPLLSLASRQSNQVHVAG